MYTTLEQLEEPAANLRRQSARAAALPAGSDVRAHNSAASTITARAGHPVWNEAAPKTLLMIASRFPPVASVGAIRLRKFARYLGNFGWKPVIITGAARSRRPGTHDARRAQDEDSLHDLPLNLPVYRLSPVPDDWPGFLARQAGDRLGSFAARFGLDAVAMRSALRWRLSGLHDRLAFPDRGIFRLPETLRLAVRLHRRYRFDAIMTSGMPFSDHLIGLAVRRVIRRPWLADFRDPWYEYIHWRQWQSGGTRRLTRWAEAAVIRSAACVVSVNDHMTRRFRERYAGARRTLFATVRNGFDPADACGVLCGDAPARNFTLLYAGSLYDTRTPDHVLAAFRRFLESVPGSRAHARFDFVGRPGPHVAKLAAADAGGCVRYLGMKSHAQTCRAMAEADLNVILLPDMPGSAGDTTTKLYECLGSRRPILAAVPPDGAAAGELCGFEGVSQCRPDDIDAMAGAMTFWYRRWLAGEPPPVRCARRLGRFTRHRQTGELASLLERITARRNILEGELA